MVGFTRSACGAGFVDHQSSLFLPRYKEEQRRAMMKRPAQNMATAATAELSSYGSSWRFASSIGPSTPSRAIPVARLRKTNLNNYRDQPADYSSPSRPFRTAVLDKQHARTVESSAVHSRSLRRCNQVRQSTMMINTRSKKESNSQSVSVCRRSFLQTQPPSPP